MVYLADLVIFGALWRLFAGCGAGLGWLCIWRFLGLFCFPWPGWAAAVLVILA